MSKLYCQDKKAESAVRTVTAGFFRENRATQKSQVALIVIQGGAEIYEKLLQLVI
jgi:hypothetical protein